MRRERLDWTYTPQDVLRLLRDDHRPFLLLGAWAGGGAILGSNPTTSDDSGIHRRPQSSNLIGGGWFGWLGYGFGATIERLPPQPPRPHPLPNEDVRFYDHVLRLDNEGQWWLEALDPSSLGAIRQDLERRTPRKQPWHLDGMNPRAPGFDGHRWAVADTVRRIAEGEIYQANITLRLEGTLAGDPLDTFADATEHHAPPYSAFFGGPRHSILSFSPELFLRHRDGTALSSPIKGTATDPETLRESPKDAAEHVMIVDLVRNDLGRVADYGSVTVRQPRIEEHPGLFHMVSDVAARFSGTAEDLIRAAFPPGSVTGAPKVQAMKVIAALEATGREAYTGAIGYLSPHAGLELNVAIRTLEVQDGHAWLGVGGGIVADSDPETELAEALTKARPVLSSLGAETPKPTARRPTRLPPLLEISRPDPAKGLLETMLAIDGDVPFLDEHLERLGDDSARERIRAAAREAGAGHHRIRLLGDAVQVSPATRRQPPQLRPVLIPGGLGDRKWADRRLPEDILVVDADGHVLEGAWANIFIVEGDRHVTPPADGRLLPGITRARVIELTHASEEPIDLDRLEHADAVYLTSAIALVTPVRRPASAPSASAVLPAGLGSSPAPGR